MAQGNVTDLFQTKSFTKRVFDLFGSTTDVSLNQQRLHIKVNSSEPLSESWLKTLECMFAMPNHTISGRSKIVKIRQVGDRSYHLITGPITAFEGSIVPLPHNASVRLIARTGDELSLLGTSTKTAT